MKIYNNKKTYAVHPRHQSVKTVLCRCVCVFINKNVIFLEVLKVTGL